MKQIVFVLNDSLFIGLAFPNPPKKEIKRKEKEQTMLTSQPI